MRCGKSIEMDEVRSAILIYWFVVV